MTRQEIAANLKAERLAAGMTQRKLGVALSYDITHAQTQVSAWESGTRTIPRDKLREIARILKIPVEQLIP